MKVKIGIFIIVLIVLNTALFSQAPDWQWAIQAGGNYDDISYGISLDDNGNTYICGHFSGTATFGLDTITSTGSNDIFVSKFDTDSNFIWTTQAGGIHIDIAHDIATDNDGNSYVTGFIGESATFGSHSITGYGDWDIFVAKINSEGNWLWAINAGSSDKAQALGIEIDENGNSYITGNFEGTASFGSYSLTSNGDWDIFIAKVDAAGNWLWANNAIGSDWGQGWGIELDDNGNIYISGVFRGSVTLGSQSITSIGEDDILVAKADSEGNWLWAANAGGVSCDDGVAIVIDVENCYVTGDFTETATFGSHSITSNGDRDIFVAKIDPEGNWMWASQAGGNEMDVGVGIVDDDNDDILVTGYFMDVATFDDHEMVSNGSTDLFIAKMDSDGNWLWTTGAGGTAEDWGTSIKIDENGNYYITGSFNNSISLTPYTLNSNGASDIFVVKLGEDTFVDNGIFPNQIQLANYPNPFNPTTTISFSIPEESNVELSIYNIKGQKIKSLLKDQITAGEHSIVWNGEDASGKKVGSGIYLYKLNVNGRTEAVKRCLLLK